MNDLRGLLYTVYTDGMQQAQPKSGDRNRNIGLLSQELFAAAGQCLVLFDQVWAQIFQPSGL